MSARTQQLAAAKAATEVATHELEAARAELSGGSSGADPVVVPAPIGGEVLRVLREEGGVVPAGTPLVELGDPASLEILVDVLTSDAVAVTAGDPAWIDGWGGERLEARVDRVEPGAFTRVSALGVEEQRVNLVLRLTASGERLRRLGDAFRVEAHVVTWQGQGVLTVPTSALFRDASGWAVYAMSGGRARLRRLEVGHTGALAAEVLRGLAPGERVILHPGDRVRDGVRVAVR